MNKRDLNLEKYGISKKRYKELCGFCEQYPEWINELKFKTDTVGSISIMELPGKQEKTDPTANLAIHRAELKEKVELIEQTAMQASPELSSYLIKAICYETPVTYLIVYEGMPCSKASFYDTRRYFFYLLDQNKRI